MEMADLQKPLPVGEAKEYDSVPPPMPRRKVSELVRKQGENLWGGDVPGDEEEFIKWMERMWNADCTEVMQLRKQVEDAQKREQRAIGKCITMERIVIGMAGLATGEFIAALKYEDPTKVKGEAKPAP